MKRALLLREVAAENNRENHREELPKNSINAKLVGMPNCKCLLCPRGKKRKIWGTCTLNYVYLFNIPHIPTQYKWRCQAQGAMPRARHRLAELIVFKDCIYSFINERVWEWGEGQRKKGRERESQADSSLSMEPEDRTRIHDYETMTWAELKTRPLDGLSHPGSPPPTANFNLIGRGSLRSRGMMQWKLWVWTLNSFGAFRKGFSTEMCMSEDTHFFFWLCIKKWVIKCLQMKINQDPMS